MKDDDSAIVRDDDSAFVRDASKFPKPPLSWSQPPTSVHVEERHTENKKPSPCEMTMMSSEEEQGEKFSECESNEIICFFNISLSVLDECFEYFFSKDKLNRLEKLGLWKYAPKKPK